MPKFKPKSNAERQAAFRSRRKAIDKSNDFILLREAIYTINQEMKAEAPGTVPALSALLDRLLSHWPSLPLERKVSLAKAKNSTALSSLLPSPRLGPI